MTQSTHKQIQEELAIQEARMRARATLTKTAENYELFPNSYEALEEWCAGRSWRKAQWDAVQDNAGVQKAQDAEDLACEKVQEAFYEDTKHINSRDHCKLVSPYDVAKIVGYPL
jgi:hypothetical protein